jgi:hypothetical protein
MMISTGLADPLRMKIEIEVTALKRSSVTVVLIDEASNPSLR